MSKPFAWSYSALSAFETCPHQFAQVRIHKTVAEQQNEQMLYGNRFHKALELHVANGDPLPEHMVAQCEPIMEKLKTVGGVMVPERKIALTENLTPTQYFAKDVWLRVVIDLQIDKGPKSLVLDYKTGKRKVDGDQLRLTAATKFAIDPGLEEVRVGYIWFQEDKIDSTTYTPDDVPGIWQDFAPRVHRMKSAIEADKFQKIPSGLCRKHCPVKSCEFNGGE
jgi:hypothetical protein